MSTPASIANLGAGFDCLALALDLWNDYVIWADHEWTLPHDHDEFTFSPTFGGEYGKDGNRTFGGPDSNRFRSTFVSTRSFLCGATGYEVPRCRCFIEQVVNIPPARGLGSSSSAAVAGAVAALRFFSAVYPEIEVAELLERYRPQLKGKERVDAVLAALAMREDRCCDNVCASTSGGLTAAVSTPRSGGLPQLTYFRNEVPDPELRAVVLIPRRQILTNHAREVTAKTQHPTDDAVFNVQRAVAWPLALQSRRYDVLAEAARDRLHQDDRARILYKVAADGEQYLDLDQVFAEAVGAGAYCAFIAGAGSSIAALAPAHAAAAVATAMETAFRQVAQHSCEWEVERTVPLEISDKGYRASVRKMSPPQSLSGWIDGVRAAPRRPLDKGVAIPPGYLTFHSYSSDDRAENVELNRMLLAGGHPVWFDVDQLQGGDAWRAAIAAAVGSSRSLMLCVGPSGLGQYQLDELDMAVRLRRRVVPVILYGGPRPSSLPPSVSERQAIIIKTKRPTPDDVKRIVAALQRDSVPVER